MAEQAYDQLPCSTRAFDLGAPVESAEALALELCPDAHGTSANDGSLTLEPVMGGLTNKLFKVAFKGRSVLLRVYGDGGIIDRVAETKQFVALAKAGRPAVVYVCIHVPVLLLRRSVLPLLTRTRGRTRDRACMPRQVRKRSARGIFRGLPHPCVRRPWRPPAITENSSSIGTQSRRDSNSSRRGAFPLEAAG